MNSTVANFPDETLSYSSETGKPWLKYELLMVILFVLGLILLKGYLYYYGQILKLFIKNKTSSKPVENPITTTTLKLLKESPSQSFKGNNSATISQVIKESPTAGPMEILNKLQRMGIFPDTSVYNTLLDNFISEKDFQKAYQLFMEVKEPSSQVSPDLNTYNIYLKGVLGSINSGGQVDISIIDELLKEMRIREISPRSNTFNEILEICTISGATCKSWSYFVMMQEEYGIEPDSNTYCIVMRGIKGNDKTPQYFDLIFPSFLTFVMDPEIEVEDSLVNMIVDICGKFAYSDKLEQLLDALRQRKKKLSLITYGKVITIYGQIHKNAKIDELFKEMNKLNLEFNEVTYGCVMEAYLRCGLYDRVEEIYNEVQRNGKFSSNIIIHTTLIRALAKKRDFYNVISHYDHLKNDTNCQFNRIAYNALLDCCVKCNQYGKMSEIFEDMLKAASERKGALMGENDVEPDLITYSTLIKGMCKSGAMHKAIQLYDEMRSKGLELDEVFFNSLLDGFVKCNYNIRESDRIINDMIKLNIKFSNYTYSILIKLYTKNKMLEKALGVLDEMKKNGIVPGVVVYTCLLQVCIKRKMVDRAIELFDEMLANKLQPDRTAYNIIINGCVFSGRLRMACRILSRAMSENVILHEDIYNNVLRNLPINRKIHEDERHESATQICNYVKLYKIPVNEEYFQTVLNNLVLPQANTEMSQQYYNYYPQGYYYYPQYYQSYNDQMKFQQPYYRKNC